MRIFGIATLVVIGWSSGATRAQPVRLLSLGPPELSPPPAAPILSPVAAPSFTPPARAAPPAVRLALAPPTLTMPLPPRARLCPWSDGDTDTGDCDGSDAPPPFPQMPSPYRVGGVQVTEP
jgi:hypothetical protein